MSSSETVALRDHVVTACQALASISLDICNLTTAAQIARFDETLGQWREKVVAAPKAESERMQHLADIYRRLALDLRGTVGQ